MGAAHAALLRRAAAEAAEAVGEDHTSAAWRAQRKHMFVLTNAGALPRRLLEGGLRLARTGHGFVRSCACSPTGAALD